MEPTTASTIGIILGNALASFALQLWGNHKVEKKGEEVKAATAAQSTVNEIKKTVENIDTVTKATDAKIGATISVDNRGPAKP